MKYLRNIRHRKSRGEVQYITMKSRNPLLISGASRRFYAARSGMYSRGNIYGGKYC